MYQRRVSRLNDQRLTGVKLCRCDGDSGGGDGGDDGHWRRCRRRDRDRSGGGDRPAHGDKVSVLTGRRVHLCVANGSGEGEGVIGVCGGGGGATAINR